MTLQPGVYYDGDEFSAKLNACDNVTLSPGVYYLNFPAGKDEWALDKNVVGPACDASGQGVQIVFADSAHIKLSGTLTLPCGRSATPNGPNIALYGLKSDIAGPGAQSYTLRPSGATSASTPAFAPLPATITTAAANYPQDGTTANVALAQRRVGFRRGDRARPSRLSRRHRARAAHRAPRGQQQGICERTRQSRRRLDVHRRLDPATDHGHRDERRELRGLQRRRTVRGHVLGTGREPAGQREPRRCRAHAPIFPP